MADRSISELFDLSGKNALVTGGTGWLGTTFCRALAEAGAGVILASRFKEKASAAIESLPAPTGAGHWAVALDHMDEEKLHGGFRDATAAAGQIHILVNNGHDALKKDLTDVTFAEFSRHQINNAGYFELARLMRDQAVKQDHPASIINIGSMYGVVASYPDTYEGVSFASPVSYHALKGGVVQMTRHLAAYYAPDYVRVNCLSPGAFPPDQFNDALVARLATKLPMKRMGRPWELKGALLLLAGDAGSYITGQNIIVDGGWTAW